MKKTMSILLVIVLVGTIIMGATMAYLTSEDGDVNVMTLGNVEIEQIEKQRIEQSDTNIADTNLEEFENDKPLYPAVYEGQYADWARDENGGQVYQQFPTGGSSAMWTDKAKNALDKIVFVENTGKSDAYVRTWFAFEQGSMTAEEFEANLGQNINDTHWKWEDVAYGVEIDGNTYAIKVATYIGGGATGHDNGVLSPGETTRPSLLQVMLYNTADNEDVEAIDGNSDGKYDILVVSQAIQAQGFDNAEAALNAGFGDAVVENHPFAGMTTEPVITMDPRAEYAGVVYPTLQEAVNAAAEAGGGSVKMLGSTAMTVALNIPASAELISIEGDGHYLLRAEGYTGLVVNVETGATLETANMTIDGGAVWGGEVDETLQRSITNTGVVATGCLIATNGNGKVVLNEGTVLQNNDGASAVALATRGGGSLTLNGAQIINNNGAGGGAVWGGGSITINEGSKINGNYATSIGGAIRTVQGAGTITMNGGEMNHNKSAGNGGAIWGGNNNTYVFNGGEIAYNSASAGGAIWTGTNEGITISGTHEMHDNSSVDLGGAIRFCNYASLTMTGGKVYNNDNATSDTTDAFYLNNNSASITGGEISDSFGFSGGLGLTIGEADIEGVIHYNLSTNHNTAYLAEKFGTFRFTVNTEDPDFSKFNFKPANGYVYTEGDEAKLVYVGEGYKTYWDAATGTFKLQAV